MLRIQNSIAFGLCCSFFFLHAKHTGVCMEWIVIIISLWIVSVFIEVFVPSAKDRPRMSEDYKDYSDYSDSTSIQPKIVQPQPDLEPDPELQRKLDNIQLGFVGNQFMSAKDKAAYLRSAEWFDLRAEVMARDNYKCTSCGTPHLLECHHISYENLGAESLDQLTILCRTCHQEVHNRLGYDRKTIFI